MKVETFRRGGRFMWHLIGLAHRAQSRKPESGLTLAQNEFCDVLVSVIRRVRPVCIAEEDSEEALRERNESSIAKEVAEESGIEHRFCDPTREERRAIGYRDGQSLELELFMHDQEGLSNDEIMLKGRAIEIGRYFPIRERFWLTHLRDRLAADLIFICGDGHVESFGRLLDDNRTPYRLVRRGIGLIDEDRWFERAVRYLREHPELCSG